MLVRIKISRHLMHGMICFVNKHAIQTDYVSFAKPPRNSVIHTIAACMYVDTRIPDKTLAIFILIYSRLCQLVLAVKGLMYE